MIVPDETQAYAEIVGEYPNQKLNLHLPRGDRGEKGDKGDKGDTGNTGATTTLSVLSTTTGVDYQYPGPQGPIGPKGDPGGWVSTSLGNVDLNTINIEGVYSQGNSSYATSLNNYPQTGTMGVLYVTRANGVGYFQQEFRTVASPNDANAIYIRTYANGMWSAWKGHYATRISNTAGRAIYHYNDTTGGEQLIYGDTGERVITADTPYVVAGWGSFRIRRIGSKVTLNIEGMDLTDPGTNPLIYTLPTGFRPAYDVRPVIVAENSFAHVRLFIGTTNGWVQAAARQSGSLTATNGIIMWDTSDVWPTTLPGVASGSIPTL
jgi:hypothetical protein